ncbi:restriction endonuclease [Maribacter chungangensis]|uniref:Restriction endonuclease n=1 Tax=Maribacter chungangensis TaxID=1069117 RepID=A0ABW3B383_9FLAO
MARRNDKATGLLIIVGFVVFIIAKVFEFIMDNIVVIGVIVGIALVIFAVVKFIEHQDSKKQQKLNIHNAILKGLNEKYEQEKSRIENKKERIFQSLQKIQNDIIALENKQNTYNDSYDPIRAISKLQNILKVKTLSLNEIWDLFYDQGEFKVINLNQRFEEKIRLVDEINKPEFFELKQNTENKDKLSTEIEQKKKELNQSLKSIYTSNLNSTKNKIHELNERYKQKGKLWTLELEKFKEKQKQKNDKVDLLKTKYNESNESSIAEFHHQILEKIIYDSNFHKSITTDYNEENKILIIEYLLPTIEQFPETKEFRYIKTRNEYKEIKFSDRELDKLYNDIIYRLVLDLISISFENDLINVIKTIVFNGWTNAINKATGLYNKACVLSVVCDKSEFSKINLLEVDPKECFKSLKGISANKISNQTPIKPIITIANDDRRFVSSQEIGIDSSTNLASMHWEDFEHLIREIFEKEFSINGGEVKVTQSSRDGGVDAIAFDPDPIRGGKIVIQAKRYTNIVGVSAVRDLYGTVMNEGATKGILVTTSDYGSDSFKFAKDKPITLINGGNLLYLLEKHGYNARINIKEAKDELK